MLSAESGLFRSDRFLGQRRQRKPASLFGKNKLETADMTSIYDAETWCGFRITMDDGQTARRALPRHDGWSVAEGLWPPRDNRIPLF
jgi:hypothetical protein